MNKKIKQFVLIISNLEIKMNYAKMAAQGRYVQLQENCIGSQLKLEANLHNMVR